MPENRTMEITVCEAEILRNDVSWMLQHHKYLDDQIIVRPRYRDIFKDRIEAESQILVKLDKFLNVKE